MNRLPNEVLSLIFQTLAFAVFDFGGPRSKTFTLDLMLVCRCWRDVTIATPAVWSCVIAQGQSDAFFERRLQRSGAVPLEIRGSFLAWPRPNAGPVISASKGVLTRLMQQASRILLYDTRSQGDNDTAIPELPSHLPRLRHLDIMADTHEAVSITLEAPQLQLFRLFGNPDWSNIRVTPMRLKCVIMDGVHELDPTFDLPGLHTFLYTLQEAPLEWLELRLGPTHRVKDEDTYLKDDACSLLVFPDLKTLILGGQSGPGVARLVSRFTAVSLKQLALTPITFGEIVGRYSLHFPNLRVLRFLDEVDATSFRVDLLDYLWDQVLPSIELVVLEEQGRHDLEDDVFQRRLLERVNALERPPSIHLMGWTLTDLDWLLERIPPEVPTGLSFCVSRISANSPPADRTYTFEELQEIHALISAAPKGRWRMCDEHVCFEYAADAFITGPRFGSSQEIEDWLAKHK